MKITTTLAVAAGLAALAACNQTPAENTADNIEANAENSADMIEANGANAADIIGDTVLAILVRSDVDPDDSRKPLVELEPPVRRRLPAVVEAHPVDHRTVFPESEQPRLGITGLGSRCKSTHLDEPEAEREHLLGDLGILVEPGREADRRREVEPGDAAPQRFRKVGRSMRRHQPQRLDRQPMRRLRVERESQRPDDPIKGHVPRLRG